MSTHSDPNNRKWLILSVIVIVLFIAWHIFSPMGIMKFFNLQGQLRQVKGKIEILEKENSALRDEIDRIENDPDYIEEIARRKFGMIRENEKLYKFKEKPSKH